jgi:hypothetical protein
MADKTGAMVIHVTQIKNGSVFCQGIGIFSDAIF